MLKILVLVFFAVMPARGQLVVSDPVQTAIQKAHLDLMALHTQFMKLQLVSDAVTLKNNYLAAKQFYDTIEAHSMHRGGLMGYYADYVKEQLNNMAAQEWSRIYSEGTNLTGPTAVQDLITGVTNAISQKVGGAIDSAAGAVGAGMQVPDRGYSGVRQAIFSQQKQQTASVDKMVAASEQGAAATNQQITELVSRGSAADIDDQASESIQMHAALLEVQLLSQIRQLLNLNAQISNSQAKQSLAEAAVGMATANDLAGYRAQAAQDRKSGAPSRGQLNSALQGRP